MFVSW